MGDIPFRVNELEKDVTRHDEELREKVVRRDAFDELRDDVKAMKRLLVGLLVSIALASFVMAATVLSRPDEPAVLVLSPLTYLVLGS